MIHDEGESAETWSRVFQLMLWVRAPRLTQWAQPAAASTASNHVAEVGRTVLAEIETLRAAYAHDIVVATAAAVERDPDVLWGQPRQRGCHVRVPVWRRGARGAADRGRGGPGLCRAVAPSRRGNVYPPEFFRTGTRLSKPSSSRVVSFARHTKRTST